MSGHDESPTRERLARLCLRSWPAAARERDGEALVRALLDGWADEGGRPSRWSVATECAAIIGEGSIMRVRALVSDAGRFTSAVARDVRASARSLARAPGFTGTVALSFALGIGANAAVFDLVDRVLFTAPPLRAPDELVFAWSTLDRSSDRMRIAAPDAAALARGAPALAALAFVGQPDDGGIETSDAVAALPVRVADVSPDLWDVLGVRPAIGNAPMPGSGEPAVLLSHDAWLRIFSGDSAAVGGTVMLDGRPVTIAGVLPERFELAFPPDVGMGRGIDVWTPLAVPLDDVRRGDGRAMDQDSDNTGAVVARLRTGATIDAATAQADQVAADLRQAHPEYEAAGVGIVVHSLREDATAHVRPLLRALLVGAAALLLVTCLNVSTLALARSTRKRREMAVRASLGAGRGALVRRLVVEALLLVTVGGVVAFFVADVTAAGLAERVPTELWAPGAARAGWTVLSAVALTGAATIAFTLVPALRLVRRGAGFATLRGGPDGPGMRGILVAGQIAVSVVIVLATGLLARAAHRTYRADPGFAAEGAVTFALSVRVPGRYLGPADRARLMREVENGLHELPGVTAVGFTTHLPLSGRFWTQPYELPGDTPDRWGERRADFRTVSSGYFDALGARLLEGRAFTPDEDLNEDGRVVVVDDLLAGRLGSEGATVGRTVRFPLDGSIVTAEIVGVVAHVRHERPERDGRETLYVPYRQEASRDVSFVVRTAADPGALGPDVRGVVRAVDPQLPVHDLRTLDSYVDGIVAPTRFGLGVVGAFAALALLAVGIGIYGVLALEVGRRRREIGVRIAVGGSRRSVAVTVLRRMAMLACLGGLGGVVTAVALSGLLSGATPGVSVADPVAWAVVVLTIGGVAGMASWLPLRRITGLDPTEALRAN